MWATPTCSRARLLSRNVAWPVISDLVRVLLAQQPEVVREWDLAQHELPPKLVKLELDRELRQRQWQPQGEPGPDLDLETVEL